jgi:hypothetical protein
VAKGGKSAARRGRAGAYIIPAAIPAALIGIFFLTRGSAKIMGVAEDYIASPLRSLLGRLSSFLPFISVAETVCTVAALWVVYHIIKTIARASRRRGWRSILARRSYALALVVVYVWMLFCWLWGVGYRAPNLAERSGADTGGITTQQLSEATRVFAERVNAASGGVHRDDQGRFDVSADDILDMAPGIYDAIEGEFPALEGAQYRPKTMMYSRVFSRLGFTGFYFAFTGESNVNTHAPRCLLPATVAHELAHQRGVFAEEEANFAGIAACVTSGNPVYEYSGALSGLMYLSAALRTQDAAAWSEILSGLNGDVLRDWSDNDEFWRAQRPDTGIGAVVNSVYDGYLKATGQPLGIKSYGACVDLLVRWTLG